MFPTSAGRRQARNSSKRLKHPNMFLSTVWTRPERKQWPESSSDFSQIDGYSYCNTHEEQRFCNGLSRCGRPNARESLCLKGNHNYPMCFPISWPEIELSPAPRHCSRHPRWYWLARSEHVIANTCEPHEGGELLETNAWHYLQPQVLTTLLGGREWDPGAGRSWEIEEPW